MLIRHVRRALVRGTVIAAACIAGAGVATAQPGAARPGAPAADAQVGFARTVDLTPAQQEAAAEVLVAQMQATAGTTQRMLGQARQARDVVKTLCLNDKLSQVDVASRSAADRKASLHAAVLRNDRELATHEFTILTVLKKRSDQLSAEANQCIGEEAAFIGATNVVTTIDPGIPTTDPTTPGTTGSWEPPVDCTAFPGGCTDCTLVYCPGDMNPAVTASTNM